jgi:hypothetical protein
MKVKIKHRTYDSEREPIMLVLSKSDKENIANMSESATKFVSYPNACDPDLIKEWMDEEAADPLPDDPI